MQMVIEIPDEDYKQWIEDGSIDAIVVRDALVNGKPLPKGHGRLIDISEYEDNYYNVAIQYDDGDRTHERYTFALPTIIEAEKGAEK